MTSEKISQLAFSLERKFSKAQEENLLSLLIDFWHGVLNLAVEFEKQAIFLAENYKKENGSTESPWRWPGFQKYLQILHQKNYGNFYGSIDAVPLKNGLLLMPFLMTMRFEPWFDENFFNENLSLQLMILFERNYIVPSRRCYADFQPIENTKDFDLLMRRVWNVILSAHSMIYNNAFAFCLNSLLPKKKIVWQDYYIAQVFSVAGSICNPKKEHQFDETTWILLSMYHTSTHANRIVQITLTQNDIDGNFLFRPYLPLTVLGPVPLLDENIYHVLQDSERLYKEISTYDIDPTLVRISKRWAQFREKNDSPYRVDKLAEIALILTRISDLFALLIDGESHIKKLQVNLEKNLKQAEQAKKKDFEQYKEQVSKKINDDCVLIRQIVHNSAGLFCLLKNLALFNKKN